MNPDKVADADAAFEHALARLPAGYSEGAFEGRPWGATVRRSIDHRRVWLFARDLGGNDIVSFNLYRTTSGGPVLKPCEMSSDKVVAFVIGFEPVADRTAPVEQTLQARGYTHATIKEDHTMDHTNHVRLSPTELTPAVLEGATIYGADDHKVGKLDHVHGTGAGGKAIIDVGGFLGIGAKPVGVPLNDLQFMRDEDGDVHAVTTWTKDQLKAMPEHRD